MFLAVTVLVLESLQPVRTLTVPRNEPSVAVFTYARDAQHEYLGTPRGLYRTDRVATGMLEPLSDRPVSAIAANDDTLYVSFGIPNQSGDADHTLHRSRDHGSTWTPIDEGLRDCSAQQWGIPCSYLISRRIEIAPGRLFAEAGGNLVVSADEGDTWTLLFGSTSNGKPAGQLCPAVFTRIGARVLLGGECPLDAGWIGEGRLRDDYLGWTQEPQRLELPLENRNVHFIRYLGDGVVYASPEGALLKSNDGGANWRFVMHEPLSDAPRYPYAYHFLVTPQLMLLGGFDKKNETGYLAYSRDNGETWIDASYLVGNAWVELLAEDADGRLLIGTYEGENFTLAEIVVGERESPRRRGVRK